MNIKKIISGVVSLLLIIIVCFAIAYGLNLPTVDRFVSAATRERLQLKRAQSYFPKSLGEYKLLNDSENKIKIDNKCNKIEDNPVLKLTGKTGDACMVTLTAEYIETVSTTTNNIVNVSLSKFTKAADLLNLLVEKSTTIETLEDKQVLRLSPLQLGWSPRSVFDLIVIQESTLTIGTSSVGAPFKKNSSSVATGKNSVAHYFLSKYSPAGEVQPR